MSQHSTHDLPPPDDPSATYVPPPEDPSATFVPDPAAGTGTFVQLGVPELLRPPARPDVPGYELLNELGHGGMGVVYRARQVDLDRDVAVKLLLDKYPAGGPSALRFADEARITGQLQHPGIPSVHQAGLLPNGRPFLAMKLIKGRTLDDLLAHPTPGGPNPVAVFEQVCQAVGYAHAHHVIHRDLKPSNVMVGAFGEVQVMDWGLAKVLGAGPTGQTTVEAPALTEVTPAREEQDATQAGSLLGTPACMPPEQAIGAVDLLDARSDVFGLGAILCVILTGKPPYAGGGSESVRQLAARGKLDAARERLAGCGADPGLVALCEWCLRPEQADRPADGGAVAAEVARLRAEADDRVRRAEIARVRAEGELRTAEVEAAAERRRRRAQRLLFAAGLLAVGLAGAGAWYLQRQAGQTRAAEGERDRQGLIARQEKDLREGRARDGAEAALARLPDLYRRGLWAQAAEALAAADALLGPDGDPALRERVAAARRDTAFVARLDRIRLDRVRRDLYSKAAAEYAAALREHGLDVAGGGAEDAAGRVAGSPSPVREYLLAALDDWGLVEPDPARRRRVFAAADRATARAWRTGPAGLLWAWDDPARLAAAYDTIPPADRSPALTAVVGYRLDRLGADGVRRLEDGRRQHPADFWLHVALGAVGGPGQAERRAGAYEAALALRPDTAAVLYNLGNVHLARRDWDRAVRAYDDALLVEKGFADAHLNRGTALREKGDLPGALAATEAAVKLDGDSPDAHCNLGRVLQELGRLREALAAFRRALDRGARQPGWTRGAETEAWAKECEGFVALDKRLAAVQAGTARPASPRDAVELAGFAFQPFKKEYALASRLYAEVYAADPAGYPAARHLAARAAVRAGGGDDPSVAAGSADGRALLDRAYGWLVADLAVHRARAGSELPADRQRGAADLGNWLKDPALAAVRDPARRAGLPKEERERWEAFWKEVEAVRTGRPPLAPGVRP
jgi:tetratricopeptide (TPR) repeat protein